MKKLFVLFSSFLIAFSSFAFPVDIDEQLLRSFAINFPNAKKVIWQESEGAYVVSFVEDRIRMRITYLRDGALTHFIRYYQEESLPLNIRLNIKKRYGKYTIYGIIEENLVSNEGRSKTIYYVKLEDASSWLTIKVVPNQKPKLVEKLNKDI